MPKFRKKPVVIEAVQLRWDTWSEMCEHAGVEKMVNGKSEGQSRADGKIELAIPTLEGVMVASENDWVIRGVKGELYPCKPDIFEATYEPVSPAVQKAMAAFDLAMVEQKVREGDAAGLVSVVAASKERRANDESASNAALCAVANDLNHERCSRTSGHDGPHASGGLAWHDNHVPQERYGGLSERELLRSGKEEARLEQLVDDLTAERDTARADVERLAKALQDCYLPVLVGDSIVTRAQVQERNLRITAALYYQSEAGGKGCRCEQIHSGGGHDYDCPIQIAFEKGGES